MKIRKQQKQNASAVRFSYTDKKKEVAHVYLYILTNDLHQKPFGFLEDLFVDETCRGKGLGSALVKTAVRDAKKRGCYKLIATTRNERKKVHRFYERLGMKKYGFEFRKDF